MANKIKLIIFDIDGVLISTRELHEIAFIRSLRHHGYEMTKEEHDIKYDGLPTKVKLDMIGVEESIRESVFNMKQKITFELANSYISESPKLQRIFKMLKIKGYKIAVCSNAIRDFCEATFKLLGIDRYIDYSLSNEDVENTKPSPEIYTKAIKHFKLEPKDSIILEDSKFGLDAAFKSGANVCHIQDPSYLTYDRICMYIRICNGN